MLKRPSRFQRFWRWCQINPVLAVIGFLFVSIFMLCSFGLAVAAFIPSGVSQATATPTATLAISTPTSTPTAKPTHSATHTATLTPTRQAQPTRQPTHTPAPTPQPTHCAAVNNNPWCYDFNPGSLIYNPPDTFCDYFACVSTFWTATSGYVVECVNGEYSHSGGVHGACSRDGGVMRPLYSH